MSMSADEMIAVIQAHKEGKQIQSRQISGGEWANTIPLWNFSIAEYRIKPAEAKKVKMLCWFDGVSLTWRKDGASNYMPMIRIPSEDKEIEIPGE